MRIALFFLLAGLTVVAVRLGGQSSAMLMANVSGGGGSITVVTPTPTPAQTNATGQTTVTVSGMTTVAGETLLCGGGVNTPGITPTSVKLSDGTSCVKDVWGTDDGSIGSHGIYRCTNIPSGITGVTMITPTADYPCLAPLRVTGLTSSPFDVAGTDHNVVTTATLWTSLAFTPTSGQPAFIGGFVYEPNGQPLAANSPYTMGNQVNSTTSCGWAYQVVGSTTSSYTVSGTVNAFFSSTIPASYH